MKAKPIISFDGVLNSGTEFKFYKSNKYPYTIKENIYYVKNKNKDIPFDELDFKENFRIVN